MALFVYVVEQRLPRELKRTRFATRPLLSQTDEVNASVQLWCSGRNLDFSSVK